MLERLIISITQNVCIVWNCNLLYLIIIVLRATGKINLLLLLTVLPSWNQKKKVQTDKQQSPKQYTEK
jgi:hypothetical protein